MNWWFHNNLNNYFFSGDTLTNDFSVFIDPNIWFGGCKKSLQGLWQHICVDRSNKLKNII